MELLRNLGSGGIRLGCYVGAAGIDATVNADSVDNHIGGRSVAFASIHAPIPSISGS